MTNPSNSSALGKWIPLSQEEREQWLIDAYERRLACRKEKKEGYKHAITLDGSIIDNLTGFYCAVGEAVNGPGGYFGFCMQAFDDCLFGGYGLESPYEIRWVNSEVSSKILNSQELLTFLENEVDAEELNEEGFEEGLKWYLQTKSAAESGRRTLFDEIEDSIRSVSRRSCGRVQVKLSLI